MSDQPDLKIIAKLTNAFAPYHAAVGFQDGHYTLFHDRFGDHNLQTIIHDNSGTDLTTATQELIDVTKYKFGSYDFGPATIALNPSSVTGYDNKTWANIADTVFPALGAKRVMRDKDGVAIADISVKPVTPHPVQLDAGDDFAIPTKPSHPRTGIRPSNIGR